MQESPRGQDPAQEAPRVEGPPNFFHHVFGFLSRLILGFGKGSVNFFPKNAVDFFPNKLVKKCDKIKLKTNHGKFTSPRKKIIENSQKIPIKIHLKIHTKIRTEKIRLKKNHRNSVQEFLTGLQFWNSILAEH